jgi:hypothetical protein
MIFKKRFQGDDVAITIYKGAAELNLPIALVPLWGEYPNVEGSLRLGIRDTTLLLLFKMRSPQLLRMVDRHNGPVYRDSCVEAFLKHAEREEYLNFEFSASGKILAAKGRSREQRTFFDPDLIDTIPRKIEILENTNRQSRYALSAELDLKAFGLVEEGEEVKLLGNFTACGDGHKVPYYLAANPIGTVKPDFHAPNFFVPLIITER